LWKTQSAGAEQIANLTDEYRTKSPSAKPCETTGDYSAIQSWAKRQKDKPSRSEAIRRLIEFALAVKAKGANTHDE
jgi:hypothetical protein